MTTATPDQINAALAPWLGWQHLGSSYWFDSDRNPTGYAQFEIASDDYFDPYHRIDHAWLLVEHVNRRALGGQRTRFAGWFTSTGIGLWKMPTEQAARAICEAIVEICEVAV